MFCERALCQRLLTKRLGRGGRLPRRRVASRTMVLAWSKRDSQGRLRPSLSALRDAEERLAAVVRRRAGQPRRLKQTSNDMLEVLGAVIPREPGQEPAPSQLVAILVAGRAGPTWDRYVPAFRDWQQFASALGFVVLPAKPADFLRFLATRAESDAGHSQTKMRICAIDAASQLAGVPSPSSDPTIGAFRRGIRRVKHAARGPVRPMFRSEIPAPEMPTEAGPHMPAAGRLSRRGLSATETARARAAAGRHLMLLSDATARYDDLNEGQLGDVLFEDNRTVIAVFGSKCDRGGAGKPVALPAASEPTCSPTRSGERWRACSRPHPRSWGYWPAALQRQGGPAGPTSPGPPRIGNVAGGRAGAGSPHLRGGDSGASPPNLRAVAVPGRYAVPAAGGRPHHA